MKRRRTVYHIDWWLITPVIFLAAIGLTVLFSINPDFFRNQLFVLVLSFFAFIFFSQFPYKELPVFSVPLYVGSLAVLLVVLILGFESRGAVRWIAVFGYSLQFSEICKPLLSITFAHFLSTRSNSSPKTYLLSLAGLAPVLGFIFLQPDLGNALIYAGVGLLTLFIYGIPLRWFFLTSLPFIITSPFLWSKLHDYQRQRVMTFLHPMNDPQGRSYNLIQAVIAVGSGMFVGKGIGEGTQSQLKFLPENHTDFIFASLAEKLGFMGTIIVLVAFVALLWRIYQIISEVQDPFGKLFSITAFLFLIVHFFVNIGMNLGLVPVVGVTLPFISYGGSSLLANFIMLGILSSISVASRKKETLQIR
jgi:rod shape determining protein RodA